MAAQGRRGAGDHAALPRGGVHGRSQIGRPDDGTDPTGFYNVEFFVPLQPEKDWPTVVERDRLVRWLFGEKRSPQQGGTDQGDERRAESANWSGVDWNFSQYIRDNVMESLSGVKGDNSVKIIGPDLDELEKLAERVQDDPATACQGIENVGIFRIKGQPNLEFRSIARSASAGASASADVENVIQTAVGGQAFTQMIEGEKTFDITLRWPERLRGSEQAILDIPVDVANNLVTAGRRAVAATPTSRGGRAARRRSAPATRRRR